MSNPTTLVDFNDQNLMNCGDVQLGLNMTGRKFLRIYENSGNGTNWTEIGAAYAGITRNYTIHLPDDRPTSNEDDWILMMTGNNGGTR